jgi:membrane-associated phospholipid phosphatase
MRPGCRRRPIRFASACCLLILQVHGAHADQQTQADILTLALPASAYWLALGKGDSDGAWALTKSLGLATVTTLALNSVIDKEAPNGSSGSAFPSGHSTIAFASAAFVQKRYGWRPAIPAYVVAAYVGSQRVDSEDHDVADVLGGAAIGIFASYLLAKPFNDNLDASVWASGKSAGLQLRLRW